MTRDPFGLHLPLALRERAYSPSSLAPAFAETLQRYREQSQAAVARCGPVEVQPYGPSQREKILLLRAPQPARATLVYVHGGYWQELSAEDSLFPAPGLHAQGYDLAAVGYSLAPEASLERIVEQVANALRHLRARLQAQSHAPRLILAGSSAGAHLVAMMLSQPWEGPPPFQGALLISGIYELAPLIGTYIDQPLQLTAQRAGHLSPLHREPTCKVPVALAWGEHETDAFVQQSHAMTDHLARHLPVTASQTCAGRDHFDILFDLAEPDSSLGRCLGSLKPEPIG
ncbi:alpha/beta hydrolase [Pseudomonas sp. NCHU5208]|uniref:alpha/beta hydrolase n=1 Tax=unclassified Pseudomonas TaxID=196821 RepID=UPI003F98E343